MNSAFPPATPLLQGLSFLQRKASAITIDDLRRHARQALAITLAVLAFTGGVLIAIGKRSHQLLKGLIILLRAAADLLERADQAIEQFIADQKPSGPAAPLPAATLTPAHHPLAQLAEDLMSNTASELRSITGIRRKGTKQALVNQYCTLV